MKSLLDVEVPSKADNLRTEQNDIHQEAINAWIKWKNLAVRWSCSVEDGKYNALDLYREVDVLVWFRDYAERERSAIAALERVYLRKPLSTAIQERFFSLSGYVVNQLRTRLDED
ncbi:hypothetical protein L914_11598 [Phytophthora nicotianae]|uniref:HAT C-terminal dimerisation domain-containing protein n=1 Tax=Phytophthora nicotianae TaxID=4792 RepID=W2N532_PHYNI|nr:hypothetical protein L914_11598 [Phytophthora nicotianae]